MQSRKQTLLHRISSPVLVCSVNHAVASPGVAVFFLPRAGTVKQLRNRRRTCDAVPRKRASLTSQHQATHIAMSSAQIAPERVLAGPYDIQGVIDAMRYFAER